LPFFSDSNTGCVVILVDRNNNPKSVFSTTTFRWINISNFCVSARWYFLLQFWGKSHHPLQASKQPMIAKTRNVQKAVNQAWPFDSSDLGV